MLTLPDARIHILITQIRAELEETVGHPLEDIRPRLYRMQVVSGFNYRISVKAGGEYMIIVVYSSPNGSVRLRSVERNLGFFATP